MDFSFKNLFSRGSRAETIKPEDEHEVKGERVKVLEIGSTGTEIFAGQLSEEYLKILTGTQAADIFDSMRRSDPKIKMVTNAMKNPIAAASWEIVGLEDEETRSGEIQRRLIEHILFNDIGKTWDRFVREALSMIEFGYSLFEVTYKAEVNDPIFGAYNGIKSLAFRSQRTIERWDVERSGKLGSVEQQAFGDGQKVVKIPAEYLLHFAIDMEGDNFEGISILRPAYGPWLRKNEFLKLLAAGIEKYAIPIPVLQVPAGKEQTEEYKKAKESLRSYVSNRCNYMIVPGGWDLDLTTNNFDAEKIRKVIDGENAEIVNAALANFLELGSSGSGSYALGTDLSDFFLGGLEYVADQIAETINTVLIPKLVKLNFPDGIVRCELRHSGIRDKAGKELAEVVKSLVDSGVVESDDRLESSLRKRFNLPEKDESTTREAPENQGLFFTEEEEKIIKLADDLKKKPRKKESGVKREIERDAESLKKIFTSNLDLIQNEMIERVKKHFRESTESQKFKINAEDLRNVPGIAAYRAQVKEELARIYNDSIKQVKREQPRFADIQMSEYEQNIRMAEVEKLNPAGRRRINADLENIIGTQIDDLSRAAALQYGMSVESTDSADLIGQDIKEATDKPKKTAASTGSLIQAAKTVNDARRDFFGEFKEEIVSFTWINEAPVSEICKHLSGRTLPADHPDVERYWPPLHHNCKTYTVANTAKTKDNPEPQNGFKPNKKQLSSVTLSDRCCE